MATSRTAVLSLYRRFLRATRNWAQPPLPYSETLATAIVATVKKEFRENAKVDSSKAAQLLMLAEDELRSLLSIRNNEHGIAFPYKNSEGAKIAGDAADKLVKLTKIRQGERQGLISRLLVGKN